MGLWGKGKVEFPDILILRGTQRECPCPAPPIQAGREGEGPWQHHQRFQGQGEVGEPPAALSVPTLRSCSPRAQQSPQLRPFGAETVSFCRQVFVNHLLPLIVLPAEKGSREGARAPGAEQG